MSTRRKVIGLMAGAALVLAPPATIAESQLPAGPDGGDPATSGTTVAAAPRSKPPSKPATAPTAAAASADMRADPGHGTERQSTPEGQSTPGARGVAPPKPTPKARAHGAPPEGKGTGSEREPGEDPATGPPPDPAAAVGPGAPPERPGQDPASGTSEPTPQSPSGTPETNGNGGTACSPTSAGLVCPGNPECVITSAGVNCASGCTVTSAGLLCPEGGEVEATPPVSGGPKKKPTAEVRGERETDSGGERGVTTIAGATGTEETSSDALPFTGAPMIALLVFGFALWAGGVLLRRGTAPVPTVAKVPAPSEPLEAVHRSTRSADPPLRGTPVLRILALLGLGMLLFRRARR